MERLPGQSLDFGETRIMVFPVIGKIRSLRREAGNALQASFL